MLHNTSRADHVPSDFFLSQNYPNPFGQTTTIKFCLPYRTRVKLDILANEEELVTTLVDEVREAGTFEIGFDGGKLQEGSYVCHFQAGGFMASKIMVVNRH